MTRRNLRRPTGWKTPRLVPHRLANKIESLYKSGLRICVDADLRMGPGGSPEITIRGPTRRSLPLPYSRLQNALSWKGIGASANRTASELLVGGPKKILPDDLRELEERRADDEARLDLISKLIDLRLLAVTPGA